MLEAFCLASGPSLALDDVEYVKHWRGPGRIVVVTNNTYQRAPWADACFAFDGSWLKHYADDLARSFAGKVYTNSRLAPRFGAINPAGVPMPGYRAYSNSGSCAISLAIALGARHVTLLGYDCQRTGGQNHWHADHAHDIGGGRQAGNLGMIEAWPAEFRKLAEHAKRQRVTVVNASRATALTCFPRVELDGMAQAA